jgi:hypothetical protein
LQLDDARKIGYVYKALGAGILVLRLATRHSLAGVGEGRRDIDERYTRRGSNLFEELTSALIMEGGDADTNACIAGALLGAWVGYSCLPPHWRDGLDHAQWLKSKCKALEQVLRINSLPGYNGAEDKDTLPDGGRGLLGKAALDARAMAFMEAYMRKTELAKKNEQQRQKQKQSWMGGLFR